MPAFGQALQSNVRIEQTPSLCVLRVPLPPGPPLPLLPLPITSRVLGSSGFESAVPSGGVRALSEGTAWGREAASPSRGSVVQLVERECTCAHVVGTMRSAMRTEVSEAMPQSTDTQGAHGEFAPHVRSPADARKAGREVLG